MTDWLAVVIAFAYIFLALGIAEWLRKTLNYNTEFTRKVVHVSVGMWAIGTVLLFQNRWAAIIPPAVFVILNAISYRRDMFKAMESENKSNLGTVYFPISFCVIILVFWGQPDKLVAALMPLTWGDAMASIFGRHYGQLKYTILKHARSVEGSVTMFLFSAAATFLALWLLPPNAPFLTNLALALGVSLAATMAEAVSPWGIDNLTIPTAAGLILYIF